MSVYPTRTATHLTLAGFILLLLGIALREPNVVAWGGALLVGIAITRSVTLLSVLRIRNAGFEMLWPTPGRVVRVTCGSTIELRAEIRNRDTLAARYDKLRVVASPALNCVIVPQAGEVQASSSVLLTIKVCGLRAGFHGIYGLALEVRGAPDLFEVPLTFANAFGIEVLPRPVGRSLTVAEGGRSRTVSATGRSGTRRGDGSELRELRAIVPGDSFRRIAWKASARRGKLMARELERDERDVVMLVLDASVELWAGAIGDAPLDHAIDAIAGLAKVHLAQGDQVGLVIVATRELAAVPVATGRTQLAAITRELLLHTGVLDADRSGWNEVDMAVQVAEHLRPVEPRGLSDLRHGRYDKLAERAAKAASDAPFEPSAPRGRTSTDAELRRYAACFGLFGPPCVEPERAHSERTLATTLERLGRERRGRPSIVHVVAPPPTHQGVAAVRNAVLALRKKGIKVRWSLPDLAAGLGGLEGLGGTASDEPLSGQDATSLVANPEVFMALRGAARARANVAARTGDATLRGMGIKVSALRAFRRGAPT